MQEQYAKTEVAYASQHCSGGKSLVVVQLT